MATLYIYGRNEFEPSWDAATIEQRQQRGHVIHAAPDNHVWGREESKAVWVEEGRDPAKWPGRGLLIHVPGLPMRDARKLLGQARRPVMLGDPEFRIVKSGEPPLGEKVIRKFQWRLNLRALPSRKRNELRDMAAATITRVQLRRVADHTVTRNRFDETARDGKGRQRTRKERNDPKQAG